MDSVTANGSNHISAFSYDNKGNAQYYIEDLLAIPRPSNRII
ncbi:MAG: hypothetical protein WB627_05050 [Candidatus Acidiferrum sp.]